jgi:phosphoglycerate dehydrogenase-like enzyme
MEKQVRQVLVDLPVEERHRTYLESQAQGGAFECRFIYADRSTITGEDVKNADVIIGNLPPALIRKAEKLEWLQLDSAGADAFTAPGILHEGALLTNASGAYGPAVSEHMLAMTFDLIRHFGQYHANQQEHLWKQMGDITSVEGSTVLVMGIGDIGGSYARKMKALGAACVIGIRRNSRQKPDWLDEQYTLEDLDQVLPRADITAMVLPGGGATQHVMDERRLRLLKKGSFLINVGRGSAIDPEGLKKVLQEGRLGGAGLDVTEPEPLPAEDALWDFDNVLITPHVAGQFFLQETFERIIRICGENLRRYADGGQPDHVVNRKTGY